MRRQVAGNPSGRQTVGSWGHGLGREKVSIVGLTPDGLLRLGCLAELGHQVVLVDESPIGAIDFDVLVAGCGEAYLSRVLQDAGETGNARLGFDLEACVAESSITLLCVDAPVAGDGTAELEGLRAAALRLGQAIAAKDSFHSVVVCAPVPPGTTEGYLVPAIEEGCGSRIGTCFGVGVWPLALTPGQAVDAFFAQKRIVLGASDCETARRMSLLLADIPGEQEFFGILAAELHGLTMQAWMALRLCFEAEVEGLCTALDVSSRDVVLPRDPMRQRPTRSMPHLAPAAFAVPEQALPRLMGAVRSLGHISEQLGIAAPTMLGLCDADRALAPARVADTAMQWR